MRGLPGPAKNPVLPALCGRFVPALSVLGLFTVLKLIKLRQAWHDSVLAMNQIKDFYIAHFPELQPAFRWRTGTIPAPGRAFTITFDLVALVALIDSAALGAAVVVASGPPLGSIAAAAGFLALQAALFVRLLPAR